MEGWVDHALDYAPAGNRTHDRLIESLNRSNLCATKTSMQPRSHKVGNSCRVEVSGLLEGRSEKIRATTWPARKDRSHSAPSTSATHTSEVGPNILDLVYLVGPVHVQSSTKPSVRFDASACTHFSMSKQPATDCSARCLALRRSRISEFRRYWVSAANPSEPNCVLYSKPSVTESEN